MAATRNKLALGATFVVFGIVLAAGILASRVPQIEKSDLGLMTSLPIYWNEETDFDAILDEGQQAHWVRAELEQDFDLILLNSLAEFEDLKPSKQLEQLDYLILAQPRALAPADFAALDSWVRAGGSALIFADPLLTGHSELPLGDPRRPQAAALMSPILRRWGLRQLLDEDQPEGDWIIIYEGQRLPVNQAGSFSAIDGGAARCVIKASKLIAQCKVGAGRALIVADAAMLEAENVVDAKAFGVLKERAFAIDVAPKRMSH